MDPNRAFRDKNKPTDKSSVILTFKDHKTLPMICHWCFASVRIDIRPGVAFRPGFVACKRCGSRDWDYGTK